MGGCCSCCCCCEQDEIANVQTYNNKCIKFFQNLQNFIKTSNSQVFIYLQNIVKQLNKQKKSPQSIIDNHFQEFANKINYQIQKTISQIKNIATKMLLHKQQQKIRQQSQMSNQFSANQNYQSQKGNIQNLKSQINQNIAQQQRDLVHQIINAKSNDQRSQKSSSNNLPQNKKKATSSMLEPFLNKDNYQLYNSNEKHPVVSSHSIDIKNIDEISLKQKKSKNATSSYDSIQQMMNIGTGQYIRFEQIKKLQKIKMLQQQVINKDLLLKNAQKELEIVKQKLNTTQRQLQQNLKILNKSLHKIIDTAKDESYKQEAQNKIKIIQQDAQNKIKMAQQQAQNKINKIKEQLNKVTKQLQIEKSKHNNAKEQIKRQKNNIQGLYIEIQDLKDALQKQKLLDKQLIQNKPLVLSKKNKQFQIQTSFLSSSSQSQKEKKKQCIDSQQYQVQTSFIESDLSSQKSTRKSIIIRLFRQSKILESNYSKSPYQAIHARQIIQNMFAQLYGENYFENQYITQTKNLFRFDEISPNKYFEYINGKNNLFLIAKLNQKTIFGGFIRYTNGLKQSTKQSFLYSITKGYPTCILKATKDVRPINTTPQYITFGDNQIRIKSRTKQCTVNIGCMGCQYKNSDGKIPDIYQFLKSNQKKFQVQDYQIYELVFQKNKY